MNTSIYESTKSEKGFTLVELAVVMVIIGLLVGGVLKGQEMIANAQVTSTVAQVRAIDAAASTFRDIFSAFPGDMAGAGARLPNCAGVCAPAGADGDTRLEVLPTAAADAESLAFFPQLESADLISGVNAANLMDAAVNGNEIKPGYTNGAAVGLLATPRAGHYLAIVQTATDAGLGLKPIDAARMDRKIDDGLPTTGGAGAIGAATCGTAASYVEATQAQVCGFLVRFQG